MRVLLGCERSGVVRRAFRKYGHDAWSCDLVPASDGSEFHLLGDVRLYLNDRWDLGIFFPDCTFLCNSGVLRLYKNGKKRNGMYVPRWESMQRAASFFRELLNAPIPRIAIENPIMHGYAKAIIGQSQTQIIQPWQFGDDASKATCIWLKNLPPLIPTNILPGGRKARRANQTPSGQNKLGPSAQRAIIRATTYVGIAEAMVEQWGR